MNNPTHVATTRFQDFSLWNKIGDNRKLLSIGFDLTARCNHNCRHCYINLAPDDAAARDRELTFGEIRRIADEAVELGALWCTLTGGEPLLRPDFSDIYLMLKNKGLLISVFSNASLVTNRHVTLFREHPPRNLEVTVYGVTQETYERVTRVPGSFQAFTDGLNRLAAAGIKVTLKAMILKSNQHELPRIAQFCRPRTASPFRFDPHLHLRLDGNPVRNDDIRAERLSPERVAEIEQADAERSEMLARTCDDLILPVQRRPPSGELLYCRAGKDSCHVSCDGMFQLCSSLTHPNCVADLRNVSLHDAWHTVPTRVLRMRSADQSFLESCAICRIVNLCLWCPAHAYLETGKTDGMVGYFCDVAHARAAALKSRCRC